MKVLFRNIQLIIAYLFKIINNKKNIYYFGHYKSNTINSVKIQYNIFSFFSFIKN